RAVRTLTRGDGGEGLHTFRSDQRLADTIEGRGRVEQGVVLAVRIESRDVQRRDARDLRAAGIVNVGLINGQRPGHRLQNDGSLMNGPDEAQSSAPISRGDLWKDRGLDRRKRARGIECSRRSVIALLERALQA